MHPRGKMEVIRDKANGFPAGALVGWRVKGGERFNRLGENGSVPPGGKSREINAEMQANTP